MAKNSLLTLIGLFMVIITMAYSIFGGSMNAKTLLDVHGIVIVFGGTISATALAYNPIQIFYMIKAFYFGMLTGQHFKASDTVKEILHIAEIYRNDSEQVRAQVNTIKDDFLREAVTLVLDEIADEAEICKILHTRVDRLYERYLTDAKKFKSIGKFPPAMGLMGAVLGMIALLGSLGAPGAEKTVGPAMSVALVATFYGIALANLIVIPVGENLVERAEAIKVKNEIVVEGVRLLMKRTNAILLTERLNSFLLPRERLDWRNIGS